MKPWGVAHIGCCGLKKKTKSKLIKKLNEGYDPPVAEDDLKQRIIQLEKFNRFLEKNFIEASLYT